MKHKNDVTISVKHGEDYTAQVLWTTSSGYPMVVSGPASMEVRNSHDDLMLKLSDSGAEDTLTVSPSSGIVTIYISSDSILKIPPGAYNYDVFSNVDTGTEPPGPLGRYLTREVIGGKFMVNKAVTREVTKR